MADDGDKGRSASGLIALLLLAVSAFVVKQLPYSSSRPETADRTPRVVESSQNVVARSGRTRSPPSISISAKRPARIRRAAASRGRPSITPARR